MKKLTLRLLPMSSIVFTYALTHENGKITHYVISLAMAMQEDVVDPLAASEAILIRAIKKEYGADVEVEILDNKKTVNSVAQNAVQDEDGRVSYSTSDPEHFMKTVPLDEEFFNESTIKALNQRRTSSLLYQYFKNVSGLPDSLALAKDQVARLLNSTVLFLINKYLIGGLNSLLHRAYGTKALHDQTQSTLEGTAQILTSAIGKEFNFDSFSASAEIHKTTLEEYQKAIEGKFFIPLLHINGSFVRAVEPCVFFVLGCGEEDLDRATASFGDELDRAADRGFIMGHLSMPGMTELANTVGNGKKIYALFVFFIINTDNLLKAGGYKNPLDAPRQEEQLRRLGFKSVVEEGGLTYLDGKVPYSDLVIQTVNVGELERKNDQDTMVAAYQEQQEAQRKIAERKAKAFNGQNS